MYNLGSLNSLSIGQLFNLKKIQLEHFPPQTFLHKKDKSLRGTRTV